MAKKSKYIKCSQCGKKIYFGELICMTTNYDDCEAFCSGDCLLHHCGDMFPLTKEQAEYFCLEIFDEDAKRREIESQIAKLQKELEALTAQN